MSLTPYALRLIELHDIRENAKRSPDLQCDESDDDNDFMSKEEYAFEHAANQLPTITPVSVDDCIFDAPDGPAMPSVAFYTRREYDASHQTEV